MISLNPNQRNTLVTMVQAHEENANGMHTLSETVKSAFVKLSAQKEALQKEVIALKTQLIDKEAAQEAARKSMQELIEKIRKEMESLIKRIDDLEHVAKEHSHDSAGRPLIKIGTKNVPNVVLVQTVIKKYNFQRKIFHVRKQQEYRPDGTVRVENVYGPVQFSL